MKKHVLLILLLLASFSSISQNDTTAVRLSDPVARRVIKDLILGDACFQEKSQVEHTLMLTEQKANVQDQLINNLEQQNQNLQLVVGLKDAQLQSQNEIIRKREKELTRVRVRGTLTIIAVGIAAYSIRGIID